MTYELFAIRYARSNPQRRRHENFLGMAFDPHDAPLPLHFFVWLAVGHGRKILIDVGCDRAMSERRGHQFQACPADSLRRMGHEPVSVDSIVSTHLHWDHAGNFDKFPNARIYSVPEEIRHAVGPCMCNATLRRPYDAELVCDFVRLVYADRVVYFDDRVEVAPGLFAHHVGGHTPGLSMVEVPTARGTVVVASDAMHFYDNAKLGMPYPVLVDLPDYFAAIKQAYSLAASPDHVIPGHDPVVMDIYPPVSTELADLAVRLDVDPTPAA